MTRVYGKGNRRRVTPMGKWSDTARINLDLFRFRTAVYIVDGTNKDDVLTGEEGAEVILAFSREGELMYLNLTSLTHTELGSLFETIKMAFANAQDIVLMRDQIAQEALENGDDSYTRVYRRVPEIIIREGQKWPNYPRVRRGFEWIAQLVPEFNTRVQDVRGAVSKLPKPVATDAGSEDSKQEAGDVS